MGSHLQSGSFAEYTEHLILCRRVNNAVNWLDYLAVDLPGGIKQNHITSVMIVSLQAKISIWELPNIKQESQPPNCNICCIVP